MVGYGIHGSTEQSPAVDAMTPETQFGTEWIDAERTILLITFPRYCTVTDLQAFIQQLEQTLPDIAVPRIDLVLLLNKAQIHGGSDLLAALHALSLQIPDCVKSIVHVNPSALTHMLTRNIGLLHSHYRRLNHFVDTLDEALELIDGLRAQDA